MTNHTTIITLACQRLEADDLIAGFCQRHAEIEDDEVIVVTTDSDMWQLKRHNNVRIINPATDKEEMLDKFDNDPMFYLFNKCMRGDPTDNIQSAYPRLRTTRIVKAYTDPYEHVQLMKETWTDDQAREILVEDIFEENRLLIDLSAQPEQIRGLIEQTLDDAEAKERAFSMFFFLQFVGKYKLGKIKEGIDQYLPMLSCK